jgi:hypothetical protein
MVPIDKDAPLAGAFPVLTVSFISEANPWTQPFSFSDHQRPFDRLFFP